ncbi:unnamed protein product [Peniophora sp. CBMAI 1063]|nr:unnamed protein product [Peniophora sp. CBMAI 1063]
MRPYTQYGSQQRQRSSQPSSSGRLSLASNAPVPSSRQTNTSSRAGGRTSAPIQPLYNSSHRAVSRQAEHANAAQSSREWTKPSTNSYYRSYGGWPNYMHSHGLRTWDYGDAQEGRAIRESYRDADRAAWEMERHQSSTPRSARRSSVDSRSTYGREYPSTQNQPTYTPSSGYDNYAGSSYNGHDYHSHGPTSAGSYASRSASSPTYYSGYAYAQSTAPSSNYSASSTAGNTSWNYRDTARYSYDSDDDSTPAASSGGAADSSSHSSSHDADVQVACSGFVEVVYEEAGNDPDGGAYHDSPGEYEDVLGVTEND